MDWASRRVLAWRPSNTLDTCFCLEALAEAMEGYGIPEIFNTDQKLSCARPHGDREGDRRRGPGPR